MAKAWINFNIPKGEGNFTGKKWVTYIVYAGVTIAVWNWSGQIPGVGPYAIRAKAWLRKLLGG